MKCYIASAFFNELQISEVEQIKKILNELEIEYFSPKDYFVLSSDSSIEKQKEILDKNYEEIENSDFIIVNTNNKDMGVLHESGYASKAKIPIIYFNSQFPKFNVMLSCSGIATCNTFEDLKFIIEIFKKNKNYKRIYEGLIE